MIKSEPLFENIFFGQQKTPLGVYEWKDVNIQAGIGDTIIDLSFTPCFHKGKRLSLFEIMIGNIQILVPYEIEVSVQSFMHRGFNDCF